MTELKFSEFALAPELHHGIADAGFTYCTPIQSKALPLALAGRDVAGQAQTGTGKTAAYLIALYQYLLTHEPLDDRQPGPRALILAPTRELAVQIHSDATLLGAHLPFKLGLAFGGTDYEKQKRQLAEGVDVLIGTPGRLIDFFKQGIFGLRRVQVAVLDEADRMFDLGFLRDIRYILRRLPPAPQRLNLLFSATLSYRVLELAYEHMNDPELIRIEPDKLTVDRVRQVIYFPSNEEKLPLLVTLLRQMDAKRTMVFVNTRRGAEHLCDALEQNGIQAAALSGDVPQKKRLKLLRDFQAGELPVLIATDVASRGLHVPDVSHVFNYDLPQDAEDYVHRVGRTARAGASGDAISFGCEDYVVSLPDIEAYIGRKIDVGTYDHASLEKVSVPASRPRRSDRREGRAGDRDARGGRRGSGGRRERDGAQRRRSDGEPRRGRDGEARREHVGEHIEAGAEPAEAATRRAERGDAPHRAEPGLERGAQERERDDTGERRRSRRGGKRRGRSATPGDAAEGRGEAAPGPSGAVDRDGHPSSPHATRGVADAETGESADAAAPAKRRRRRRGRRGSRGETAPSIENGSAEARGADRDQRPRERAAETRAAETDERRRDRSARRSERAAERHPASEEPSARDVPDRQDGVAEERPRGLLARLWTALRR